MGIVHPYFDFDNDRFGALAVERLAARGRGRLALMPPPPHLTYAHHMTAGFQRAVEAHDILEVAVHGVTTDSPYEAIRAEVARLMAARLRPDGFVCASASAAIATVASAEDLGFVIGRDFDVAVKESFDMMSKFRREIAVVNEDFRRAGGILAEAVVRTIAGDDPAALQTLDVPGP